MRGGGRGGENTNRLRGGFGRGGLGHGQIPSLKSDVAPAGYVAGVGRGALGFTTRSDVGPAREVAAEDSDDSDGERVGFDGGDAGLLSGGRSGREEDDEADRVWAAVERRRSRAPKAESMSGPSASEQIGKRFADLRDELSTVSHDQWASLPDIGDHTQVYKRRAMLNSRRYTPVPDSHLELARQREQSTPSLAASDEPGDLGALGDVRQNQLQLSLGRASDSVRGQTVVDPQGYLTSLREAEAPRVGDAAKTRPLLLAVTQSNPGHAPGWIALARLEESVGKLSAARAVIKQGCLHCGGEEALWLEAARLAGRVEERRGLLAVAAGKLGHSSEAVWEAAVAAESDVEAQRRVLRRALEAMPSSARLWRKAVDLEAEDRALQARILQRAVQCIPHDVELWLRWASGLADVAEAREVLNRARETLPSELAVWVAAAQLEERERKEPARLERLLRRAALSIPRLDRWRDEAVRCEKEGSLLTARALIRVSLVQRFGETPSDETKKMEKANRSLVKHEVAEWVAEGMWTCARAALEWMAVDRWPGRPGLWVRWLNLERDRWASTKPSILNSPDLGEKSKEEKIKEEEERVRRCMRQAVDACPHSALLGLLWARFEWRDLGRVDLARSVLRRTRDAVEEADSETREMVWLASEKLERATGRWTAAAHLLQLAWMRGVQSARVARKWARDLSWIDSSASSLMQAVDHDVEEALDRERQRLLQSADVELGGALACVDRALERWPKDAKLWVVRAELEEAPLRRSMPVAEPLMDFLQLCSHLELPVVGDASASYAAILEAVSRRDFSGLVWNPTIKGEGVKEEASSSSSSSFSSSSDSMHAGGSERSKWATVRALYQRGLAQCPGHVPLWIAAARAEESGASWAAARAVLEAARLRHPKNDALWVESIEMELRARSDGVAPLLARALADCPRNGRLRLIAALMEPVARRKALVADALTACPQDPDVHLLAAKVFRDDRRYDKALAWLDRALAVDPSHGDLWTFYWAVLQDAGLDRTNAYARCVAADPRAGPSWRELRRRFPTAPLDQLLGANNRLLTYRLCSKLWNRTG